MIRIRSAALALVLSASFSTVALAAGEISADALTADRQSCQSACTDRGQTVAKCTNYCDCTVKGIDNQLTLDEYRALSDAAAKKEPAPDATVAKLKTITGACRAKMAQ
jgi:hypothetical protein